ncbi:venom protease-like [Arctopsyche grandis]|uniref:venom protease-like n=1 Tax=Arctopsyche grandis TaxID=121162 RepID=UPI00406D7E57
MRLQVLLLALLTIVEYTSSNDEDLYDFFGLRPRTTTKRTKSTTKTTEAAASVPPVTEAIPTTTTTKAPTTTTKAPTTTTKAPTTTTKATTTTTEAVKSYDLCGSRKIDHVGLITGGWSTLPGDWPWHTALYKLTSGGVSQSYICGGTLVSHTRVITAGHCVVENGAKIDPERLTAYFGRYNLAGGDPGSQQKSIYDIVLHPNYNYTNLANDISILKLSTMVYFTEYVQPICLWNKDKLDKSHIFNKDGVVVGWGFTENDVLSTKLLMASIPGIDDWDCLASNPDFFSRFLTRNTYCAGYANGTSPCNGDSGGGMYFPEVHNGKKTWHLRGIISLSVSRFDVKLCDPYNYTIFTDVARYLDFVGNYVLL